MNVCFREKRTRNLEGLISIRGELVTEAANYNPLGNSILSNIRVDRNYIRGGVNDHYVINCWFSPYYRNTDSFLQWSGCFPSPYFLYSKAINFINSEQTIILFYINIFSS